MGLDDFKSEDSSSSTSSEIKTRKKLKNITFDSDMYDNILTAYPILLESFCASTDEAGKKAIVQRADEIIEEEGTDHIVMADDSIETLKEERDIVVEEHNLGDKKYD